MRKPNCEIIDVTPKQAEAWLGSNVQNRKISQWRVNLYAAAMKRGDWFLTNQGLGFDVQGNLIDGQNRLSAVITSGCTVKMLVMTGLDKRSQIVIDIPLVRRAHDQIKLSKGYDVTPRHIAVAKQMFRGVSGRSTKVATPDPTQDIVLLESFYIKHHKAIEFSLDCFQHKIVKGVTVAGVASVIARAYYSADSERLRIFGELLVTGMLSREKDSAAIALRNWLLRPQWQDRMTHSLATYRKTEPCLIAFLKEERLSRACKPTEVELFPLNKSEEKEIAAKAAA